MSPSVGTGLLVCTLQGRRWKGTKEAHPIEEDDAASAGTRGEKLFSFIQELHKLNHILVHTALPAKVRFAQALRLPSPELGATIHAMRDLGSVLSH